MFGLFLCGFGLAFTIKANLGLNSWDVFHDGFSKLIGVKIGFAGVLTGFILLLGWIPLKQKPFIVTKEEGVYIRNFRWNVVFNKYLKF